MQENNLPETIPIPSNPSLLGRVGERLINKRNLWGVVFFLFSLSTGYALLSFKDETTSPINPVAIESKIISARDSTDKPMEVIGFLPSWTIEEEKINDENLNQLIYFGLGVNDNGNLIKYNAEGGYTYEWKYLNSEKLKTLKQRAHANGAKVLIAVKNFDNQSIDRLVSNQYATSNFIKQIVGLIESENLDGVNIDFEYVTDTEFPTVKYFNRFIEQLSEALHEKERDYLLSIDINATAVMIDRAYDMVKIGEVCDQVILMAYDYHQADSIRAGPVAPIYASENEHSIDNSIRSLAGRVPKEKLILGIPFYGYEWQTVNSKHKSPTINNSGALATYKRVSELAQSRGEVVMNWNDEAQSPWLVYEQSGAIKQIYFENADSIAAKLNYVREKALGGIAIWALGYEGKAPEIWNIIKGYAQQ